MGEKKIVAAVFAHPDDETLGCGATLAKMADESHEVHIIVCGEGITARYDNPAQATSEELASLDASLHRAAEIIGAQSVHHLDWPDNRFDSRPLLDLTKAIEKILGNLAPQVVFTQHGGDLNLDHQYVNRAVMAACRPLPGRSVREIYGCEVLSATGWLGPTAAPFLPTRYVDISSTLQRKIDAMAAYDSESAPFPHPRSPEAIRAQAMLRGTESGLHAAEAFMVLRQIG